MKLRTVKFGQHKTMGERWQAQLDSLPIDTHPSDIALIDGMWHCGAAAMMQHLLATCQTPQDLLAAKAYMSAAHLRIQTPEGKPS